MPVAGIHSAGIVSWHTPATTENKCLQAGAVYIFSIKTRLGLKLFPPKLLTQVVCWSPSHESINSANNIPCSAAV